MLDRMFLGAAADDKLFVEDVFSTYLYTGNSGTQTITNGIDLAGKGGLIWLKSRSSTAGHPIGSHALFDTVRGIGAIDYVLRTNLTDAQNGIATIQSVNSDGFTFGGGNPSSGNFNGETYASWTFREAPKFFDIVTYTGDGTLGRQISHSLGVVPGFAVVKRTNSTGNWMCVHRDNPMGELVLNSTAAQTGNTDNIENRQSTYIVVSNAANISGATYVAYLFAHDATADGIIQCGSVPSGGTVNLGWEPQWVMVKGVDVESNWYVMDSMRGWNMTNDAYLQPNNASAEASFEMGNPTPTGFSFGFPNSGNNIYIAIRRGPMRTPTLGTSVFAPVARTGTGATVYTTTSGFAPDSVWMDARSQSGKGPGLFDRLRGLPQLLQTTTTSSEVTNAGYIGLMGNTGYTSNADAYYNTSSQTFVDWIFRRAPGFFDEVCYTGTGATTTQNHNLGVVPELVISKARSATSEWQVNYSFGATTCGELLLNQNFAGGVINYGAGTAVASNPTASQIQFYAFAAGQTRVAYLFASAPGVSKVGSYTGNGSSQTINCAFTTGARFVMIKRTDSTGDWYVWDTARGIVAANDPRLSLNTTAAEVTTDDSVDTDSSGFVVNQVAATNVNVNAATYIYLAIA